jgi:hypothetical protein
VAGGGGVDSKLIMELGLAIISFIGTMVKVL